MAALLDRGYDAAVFQRVRNLLAALSGWRVADSKFELVHARLSNRMRRLKIRSYAEYLDVVESDPAEQERFINAMTTNVTAFFREPHHMACLAEFARRRAGSAPLRVWSAACSTGEEPYSIAMTLSEAARQRTAGPFAILATDIDSDALEKAKGATYTTGRSSDIPLGMRARYLYRGKGRLEGHVRVVPEVAETVEFARVNLLEDRWPALGTFDAIFCRNVLIYFDRREQQRIVTKMHERLVPGGLFFTGHSESLLYAGDLFEPCGRTTYRRLD